MIAEPFRIIAHRGASAYAPENTMVSFRKAVEMGAPEVETDVAFTKDRRLLLFHDHTLERTTNGKGTPSEFTLEELKCLDAGSWMEPAKYPEFRWEQDYAGEKVIALEELFDAFGKHLVYHVEIKDYTEGLIPAVIACVRHYDLVEQVFLTVINDEDCLLEAKRIEPRIRTALAPNIRLKEVGSQAIEEVARAGHDMVTLSSFNQNRELVDLAHGLGMEARSSGIKNRQQMIEAVEIGCNGMTINWPDWLIDHISRLK